MQLLKDEYARKRIHNGCLVQIENTSLRITVRHPEASKQLPSDRNFNLKLKTIKESYILTPDSSMQQSAWPSDCFL